MKKIITVLTAAGLTASLSACQSLLPSADSNRHIRNITAVTEVFGDGQKITSAIIQYDTPINGASLSTNDYSVSGRTVTHVYASDTTETGQPKNNGEYVVIELSPADEDAVAFGREGRDIIRRKPVLNVMQKGTITTVHGRTLAAADNAVRSSQVINRIVDDFRQSGFTDPQTGITVKYNLFVPKNYNPQKTYPLVLFLHDAGVNGSDTQTALRQGLGAVVWASPEEQEKHPAFVLAPQFDYSVANVRHQTALIPAATANLIKHLETEYRINPARRYVTGQSDGATLAMVMNIKYPDLFAASYLVAGKWDATLVIPPLNHKMWITVAESDEKAHPGMSAVTANLENHGAKVARATWSGFATPVELNAAAKAMHAQDADIRYVALRQGATAAEGQNGDSYANHMNTWRIAYGIANIRDWLFEQYK
ncbi:alpha/beta hydrolase-fold protein [Neisseria animaloris]|uniref:alpha/beta hydrolase-fold protein n=1 Tax=Neisseria animaloris TaxID=326522 RepID=UPI000D3401DD|nr:PHB depolymerase family esterase [Neisseria animaloris]